MQATLLPPRNPAFCAPITSNRDLGACLIANIPMRELLAADLRRAGLQLVEPSEAEPRALRIPIDNWIELGALLMLGRNPRSACLVDSAGNVEVRKLAANASGTETIRVRGKNLRTGHSCTLSLKVPF